VTAVVRASRVAACLVLALPLLAPILSSPALCGGPRKTTAAGQPILWDTSIPIAYFVDRGGLGTLSNDAANQLVADGFKTWGSVEGAGITFVMAGQLLEDIDGTSYRTDAYPPAGSGISAIVYDSDGSVLESELGEGAQDDILGITSYDLVADGELREVAVILNGRCFDGDSGDASPCEVSYEELRGVVLHELGHFAGLDHSDLNREFVRDGRCANDGTIACTADADCAAAGGGCAYRASNNAVLPTMFPVESEDDSTLATLHLDDELALARLYPQVPFPSGGGTVQGRVCGVDGMTPVNGANVVLRNLADPYVLAASAVSGDVRPPGAPSRDGFFRIEGLPPGNYSLEVRGLPPAFSGPLAVGQHGRCEADPAVACWCDPPAVPCVANADCAGVGGDCDPSTPPRFGAPTEFLSDAESADATADLPGSRRILKLGAGTQIVSGVGVACAGIDVIVNDLATLTNDLSGAGNDTCATATPVAPPGGVLGDRILVGDVDYFRIAVPAGWRLRVDVDAADEGLGSTLEPIVQLRDGCGAVLAATPIPDPVTGVTGADPALDYVAPADVDVTVAVSSVEGSTVPTRARAPTTCASNRGLS
jgi:hypothetical protein